MKPWLLLIPGVLMALCLSGCLRGTPPPAYYRLAVLADFEVTETRDPELRLGVVLKGFPEALERIQILTRDGYQVGLSEQHRWAAPLRQELERVLVGNLGRQLGLERVAAAPWPPYFAPTNRLVVDVLQFDGALCGEVEMQVRWVLTDASGKIAQLQQAPTLREGADCNGYDGYVAAQSRALARLSAEIAAAVKDRNQPLGGN